MSSKQAAVKMQLNSGKIISIIVNLSEDGTKFRIAMDSDWHLIENSVRSIVTSNLRSNLEYSVCKLLKESYRKIWSNLPEYHISGLVYDDITPDYKNIVADGTAKLNETNMNEIWIDNKVYTKLNNDYFEFMFDASNNPFKKSSNLHGVTLYKTDHDFAVRYELN